MKKRDKRIIAVALVGIVVLVGVFSTIYPAYIPNGGNGGCTLYTSPPSKPVLNDLPTPDTDGKIYLHWSIPARICHYDVERKLFGGAPAEIKSNVRGDDPSNPKNSYMDTISDNGNYGYRIKATNNKGDTYSDYEWVVVQLSVPRPAAPTLNTILPLGDNLNGVVEFNWYAVSGAASYNVYRRKTYTNPVEILKSGITGTGLVGYTDSGLSSGTYYYAVTAVNSGGESDKSNIQSKKVVIPNEKPTATIDSIDPIYAEQGVDTISFSGYGSDTDGTISIYQWLLADETILSSSQSFQKPASEFNIGDIIIYFRVKDNSGEWSDKVSRLITIEEEEVILKPVAPHLGNIQSSDDDGIIQLSWSIVYEADTYNVYRNGVSIKSGLTINSYTDRDLSNGTYTYKITAVNIGGESDYSNEETVVVEIPGEAILIPNIPVQYHLPDYDYDGNINLQWFVVYNADSYNIYRSSDGVNFNKVASGITGNTYTDSVLINGTYYYKITAVNTNGESDFSDVESIEVIEVEQEDLTGAIVMLIFVIIGGIAVILVVRRLKKKI